jgi:hypothetical protein
MNDHFASIVHRDRMAAYRAEADSERLLGNDSKERPDRARVSAVHRWVASVAGALLLIVGRPRLG